MSVRMHITHGKTRSRRAHDSVAASTLVKTAGGVRRRHFADVASGTYRGKPLAQPVGARTTKKAAPAKKKATPKATKKKADS